MCRIFMNRLCFLNLWGQLYFWFGIFNGFSQSLYLCLFSILMLRKFLFNFRGYLLINKGCLFVLRCLWLFFLWSILDSLDYSLPRDCLFFNDWSFRNDIWLVFWFLVWHSLPFDSPFFNDWSFRNDILLVFWFLVWHSLPFDRPFFNDWSFRNDIWLVFWFLVWHSLPFDSPFFNDWSFRNDVLLVFWCLIWSLKLSMIYFWIFWLILTFLPFLSHI